MPSGGLGHETIGIRTKSPRDGVASGLGRAAKDPLRQGGDAGVDEDEATGAAAVQLCGHLGRAIDIRQGRGSRILARPHEDGAVEIGGRSLLDEVREYAIRES